MIAVAALAMGIALAISIAHRSAWAPAVGGLARGAVAGDVRLTTTAGR
jgi:hypothetical protein